VDSNRGLVGRGAFWSNIIAPKDDQCTDYFFSEAKEFANPVIGKVLWRPFWEPAKAMILRLNEPWTHQKE